MSRRFWNGGQNLYSCDQFRVAVFLIQLTFQKCHLDKPVGWSGVPAAAEAHLPGGAGGCVRRGRVCACERVRTKRGWMLAWPSGGTAPSARLDSPPPTPPPRHFPHPSPPRCRSDSQSDLSIARRECSLAHSRPVCPATAYPRRAGGTDGRVVKPTPRDATRQ